MENLNLENLPFELTINNVLIGVVTVALLSVGYLVLFTPGKKQKEENLKNMAFDDMMDDKGWAEEEEEEKPKPAAPAAPAGGMPNIPMGAPRMSMPQQEPEVIPNSHDPNLPFQIGDRVVLQKLVGAAELNGRHGVIAAPYDKKTSRYPVDLDLFHNKPLAVKEGNLAKEGPAPPPKDMPSIVNGCLEPHHAKACGFIFHVMRKSCSQTLGGDTNAAKLAAFGWQFWSQNLPDNKDVKTGVYPSLLQYLSADILKNQKLTELDKQVSPDPSKPIKGAYSLVTRAMKSKQAVASWNVRVEGAFWIVGMGPQGTMVVPDHNTRQVYVVAGFQAPLMAVAGGGQNKFPRPPKFHLSLVPWFGVLVHDSFLCTTTGSNQVELASPQLANELVLNSKRAVAENRLITSLAQLQMEEPNTQGVPYQKPPAANNAPPQKPATPEEKELTTKLAKMKDIIGPPNGLWNFVKPPNGTDTYMVLNAKGEKFADFKPPEDTELPLAILGQIVKMCEAKEKVERPAAIGVDDPKVCQRLQFLCWQVPNMRVLMLNVKAQAAPPKEEGEGDNKAADAKPAAE